MFFATRTNAVQDSNSLRLLAILQKHLAGSRAAGVDQPLHFHSGHHVRQPAVAILWGTCRVEITESGSQDDGPDFNIDVLFLLLEVYRIGSAELLAGAAFSGLEIGAVDCINDRDARHGLRKGIINGWAVTQAEIELGWDLLPRAFFHTSSTAVA